MLTKGHSGTTSLLIGLLLFAVASSAMAIQVEVNGNPLTLSASPRLIGGTTMVPLRGIFESLGAEVQWNDASQLITATKGNTDIRLAIGDRRASVNGRDVQLEAPARIINGSTMVPLRFVSEALGAYVNWDGRTQTVSITSNGNTNNQTTAQGNSNTEPSAPKNTYTDINTNQLATIIPDGTVIPVRLDRTLSSKVNHQGDRVIVTVRSQNNGDSELPLGSKMYGVLTEAQPAGNGQPGILGMEFREVVLPDGKRIDTQGTLVSLDDKTVEQTTDGRLVMRNKSNSNDQLKFIGIGAAGGLILGKLTKHTLEGTILGAAAGYLYSQNDKKKNQATDVTVSANTEFGVQLSQQVSYYPSRGFTRARQSYVSSLTTPVYATSQNIRVTANGRNVAFANAKPFRENGVILVPLAPVLKQEGVAYKYDDYSQSVSMDTDQGALQLSIGKSYAMLNGEQVDLEAPAQIRDGVVYVPLHFLSLATGSNVKWIPNTNTADLSYSQ